MRNRFAAKCKIVLQQNEKVFCSKTKNEKTIFNFDSVDLSIQLSTLNF
jgi:hypothetical protein